MLKLWFLIEFQKNNKGKIPKIIVGVKLLLKYLMLIGLFFQGFNSLYNMLEPKAYLPFFVAMNGSFLIIFQGLIQIFFFKTLEKDVVISFLPERAYNYIRIRIFMQSIRWNLAFTLPSIFFLKGLFNINNIHFYMDLALLVVTAIIINYLIAIYLRYALNISGNVVLKKIITYFSTMCISIVFIGSFSVSIIQILNSIGKEKNVINHIYINNYSHLLIIVIFIIALLCLKLTDHSFQKNSSKLIINVINNKENNSPKFEKIVTYFIKNKSFMDKTLITKDLKGIVRGFSYGHFFFILIQILIIAPLTFFYLNTKLPKSLEESIVITSIFSVILLVNNLIIALIGGAILKKKLEVLEDEELLLLYGIKYDRRKLIDIKVWTTNLIVNGPMYIFYIVILVSKINIWSLITSICIIISSLLLGRIISLIVVKIINNTYSNKTLIQVIGIGMYIIIGYICVNLILNLENMRTNIMFYCIYNVALLIIYFYDSRINIKHEEGWIDV